MSIQLIKAFINPLKNRGFVRHYLMRKVADKHKNMKLIKGSYEDMFTEAMGTIVFWYNKPLNDNLTTGCEFFKSSQYYKVCIINWLIKLKRGVML